MFSWHSNGVKIWELFQIPRSVRAIFLTETVFSLGFNWILHYLLVGKRDAYCAHFWRKNWDIIIKVGREHENIGTKSATICIWLLIWTPWIFLDNILFGETQSPPEQPFFPVCKAQALSLPGPAVAEQAALEVTLVFHPCKLSQPHITHRSKPSLLPWHLLQEAKGTLDPAPRLNPKYSSFTRSLSSMKGALAQPHKIPQDKNHPRVHLDDGKHSGITAHTAKQNISPISLSTTCIWAQQSPWEELHFPGFQDKTFQDTLHLFTAGWSVSGNKAAKAFPWGGKKMWIWV